MHPIRTVRAWVTIALLGFSVFSIPAYAKTKKIVFLAGPVDHGGRGRRENERDLKVLAYCLNHSTNLKGVTHQVYADSKAPADLNVLKDASVIVVESSSDQRAKENHALFPNNTTTDGKTYDAEGLAYLKGLDGVMKKGVGLVVFHYANQIANETARQYFLDWLGAYWKEGVSANPMDDWSMTVAPQAENHPILRGVKPWTYHEEIFCRFYLPENPARTSLLIGTPAKNTTVGPQVASFAYQRKEGGRGFVMGGLDFNSNMLIEDNRRFLLNGIVWAAGMDVPAGGVASSSIPEDMVVVSPPRPARPPQ